MARLLLVCDDPGLATSLQLLLDADHTVEHAATGQEVFLRIAARERFDVIFCDLDLPDMRGETMKSRLSGICPEMSCRVVFLTDPNGCRPTAPSPP